MNGAYVKGEEFFNFNFYTSLTVANKLKFVNSIIDILVDDMINDIKISMGKIKIDNECELRSLIKKKIERKRTQEKKVKAILSNRINTSIKEKETLERTFRDQLAHRGREEQEKYYKSKGYEPAS